MNINFKLIGTFLSVAQNESFRRAAEETNRSLPAVSMQVKQLEEQLGVALFQRTTRKVTLTQEGEQLLISARKALAELEVGLSHIQHAADVQQGHLSFACVPTIASTRLPAILTAFAKKYPGISVHVRELANQDLLEAVRRREVDFAIGPVPEKKGELEFAPIFVDDYCAMLPRGYQDNGRASIRCASCRSCRCSSCRARPPFATMSTTRSRPTACRTRATTSSCRSRRWSRWPRRAWASRCCRAWRCRGARRSRWCASSGRR